MPGSRSPDCRSRAAVFFEPLGIPSFCLQRVGYASAYLIALVMDRQGLLQKTMGYEQYYFLGALLFAFTAGLLLVQSH